jgi:hypothetical protein
MKLSEKGYEQRSKRGIGRYIEAKTGRTVWCRCSVQLRFGCLQDFSDSFLKLSEKGYEQRFERGMQAV